MQEWQDPYSWRIDRKELEAERAYERKQAYRKELRKLAGVSFGLALTTSFIIAGVGMSVIHPVEFDGIELPKIVFWERDVSADKYTDKEDSSDVTGDVATESNKGSLIKIKEQSGTTAEDTGFKAQSDKKTYDKKRQSDTPAQTEKAKTSDSDETPIKTDSIHYDTSTRSLSLELNGKSIGFPSTSRKISKAGWETVDVAEDPDKSDLAAVTMYDEPGSTLFFYHPKESDTCSKIEVLFASKDTTFMGMNMQSEVEKAEKIFKNADSVETKSYIDGNGQQIFHYGRYTVTVNFANGYVFSAAVETER